MRIRRILVCVVLIVAGSAMLEAAEDLPFDRKGLQESGYSLSQYESVSLSNGNLTFHIPIFDLQTDGGLGYPVVAYFNSKLWYDRSYCTYFGAGLSCTATGGAIVSAEIADGVEAYGFGWDLRPPRIVWGRFLCHMKYIDTSGSSHSFGTTVPPWPISGDSPSPCDNDGMSVEDQFFTWDGTNLRFTVKAIDTRGKPTVMEMEDGTGNTWRFAQVVPESCEADYSQLIPPNDNSDNDELAGLNFGHQVSGLYLTSIRRGPYASGGDAANEITFFYQQDSNDWAGTCGGESGAQWLVTEIKANGNENNGDPARSVAFNYNQGFLTSIGVPAFNPALESTIVGTATIDWQTEEQTFHQHNAGVSQDFTVRHLTGVSYPSGASFAFDDGLTEIDLPLLNVRLPTGALIEYESDKFSYPVGQTKCVQATGSGDDRDSGWTPVSCGVAVPNDCDPGPTPKVRPDAKYVRSWGIRRRQKTYLDASGNTRAETTRFYQGLSCAGVYDFNDDYWNAGQWPYDFGYALEDDVGLKPEYLWTLVERYEGDEEYSDDIVSAEIHRFHAITREEFSSDVLTGAPEALKNLEFNIYGDFEMGVRTTDPPPEEGIGVEGDESRDVEPTNEWPTGVRVLRHTEIEQKLKYGENIPSLTASRYSYLKETRTYTDEDSAADDQSVKSCYLNINPGGSSPPEPTCEVVVQSNEVDDYLNLVSELISYRNPGKGGLENRLTTWGYDRIGAEDSGVWTLHRKSAEVVSDGSYNYTKNWRWTDLSASGQPANYHVTLEVLNPSDVRATCTSDCVAHDYGFDSLGNRITDTISGGYGSSSRGFPDFSLTTKTGYRHGKAVKKELISGSNSLLLWQREVDPGTGLPRWHIDGSGFGFAYLWDEAGRVTDIAPIDGRLSDQPPSRTLSWYLYHQKASEPTAGTPTKGLHVEYLLPLESSSGLLEHRLFDATWSESVVGGSLPTGSIGAADPRSVYSFDGLGRLTKEMEKYIPYDGAGRQDDPDLSYRSRYHLSFLHNPTNPESCDEVHSWDISNKSRVKLDSGWIAGDLFQGCPTEATWSDWTESQLDGLNRPALIHQPDGQDIETSYSGDTKSTTTQKIATALTGSTQQAVLEDISTISYSDPFGRLIRLEEELGGDSFYQTDYEYDPADRLTKISLWNPGLTGAQERSFSYSDGGFLTAQVEPERSVNYLSYDALGHPLSWQTVGSSDVFSSVYDGFGRLKSTSLGADLVSKQVWGDTTGAASAAISFPSYNQIVESTRHNRFVTADVPVTERFEYNGPAGQISGKKLQIGGFGESEDGFQLNYGYDAWGNEARVYFPFFAGCRYSDWESLKRSFDGQWLESVSLSSTPEADYPGKPIGAFDYHPSGRVARESYGEGISHWDEMADPSGMARPAEISITISGAKAPLPSLGPMRYDGAGNIWALGNRRYAYDGLSRLKMHERDGGPVSGWTEWANYDYDRWGNLTSITRLDPAKGTSTLTFDFAKDGTQVPLNNQIETVTPSSLSKTGDPVSQHWDERGNLDEQYPAGPLTRKRFSWSSDDRLMESTDNPGRTETVWRYAYDAAGERVLKWENPGSGLEATVYVRDESGRVLSEWNLLSGGAGFDVHKDYLYGAGREIAEIGQGAGRDELLYVGVDHLGSTRATFDDTGLSENQNYPDYYPFGMLRDEDQAKTTHLFTGHERDLGTGSSGLDYMHQRYYSPILGRFISVDPVMGDTGSSQSANRYSYVLNNPVRLVDPDGRDVTVAIRPVSSMQAAGHAYIVVTPTGANKTSDRFAEYLHGKNRFSLSGSTGSRMVGEFEQHNRLISLVNHPMDEMGDATQLFNVNPPDGVSMEEFEKRILDAFESFESGREHYNNFDFNFSGRNSNAFATGLLNDAGVDVDKLPPIIDLAMPGWGDPVRMKGNAGDEADTQIWLEQKRREMAAQRAQQ